VDEWPIDEITLEIRLHNLEAEAETARARRPKR
jgi:hypothetical protein